MAFGSDKQGAVTGTCRADESNGYQPFEMRPRRDRVTIAPSKTSPGVFFKEIILSHTQRTK